MHISSAKAKRYKKSDLSGEKDIQMKHIKTKNMPISIRAGRLTTMVVDPDGAENKGLFYANFSQMRPGIDGIKLHKHEEEFLFILRAQGAYFIHGKDPKHLVRDEVRSGMAIIIEADEWHRFDFDSLQGKAEMINFIRHFPPHIFEMEETDLAAAADYGKDAVLA